MAKMTNLYDATKCTACRGCSVACKNWNQNPAWIEPFKGSYQTHEDNNYCTYTMIKFNEEDGVFQPNWYFSKFQCMHCTDPACMKVCPRKAISQTKWGAVVKDYDRCVGCQYCSSACPFGVPKYDPNISKVTKCTLCSERVEGADEGFNRPACAKTCPTGALTFGDRDELLSQARERVKWLRANGSPNATIYGEHELGGLNKIYILGDTPDHYGLPVQPKVSATVPVWKDWVQPYVGYLIPLALAGSAVSFFTTRFLANKQHASENHGEEA
ncbi:MAG: 4Fe-4S dicluster domain-containing protein [Solirubrobacterales bacterium]